LNRSADWTDKKTGLHPQTIKQRGEGIRTIFAAAAVASAFGAAPVQAGGGFNGSFAHGRDR
jgi:hypothetical protein